MRDMQYVYILESMRDKSRFFGTTNDLKNRLHQHNSGETESIKSKAPFRTLWYCCFEDKHKALEFEHFLRSDAGHAFISKHIV